MVKKSPIEVVDLSSGVSSVEEIAEAEAAAREPVIEPESDEAPREGQPDPGEEKAPESAGEAAERGEFWEGLDHLGSTIAGIRDEGLPVSPEAARRERVAQLAGGIKDRSERNVADSGIREAIAKLRGEAEQGRPPSPADIARAARDVGLKLQRALHPETEPAINVAEQLRDLAALADREEIDPEDLRRCAVLVESEAERVETITKLSREALDTINESVKAKLTEERESRQLAVEVFNSLISGVRENGTEAVQIQFPRGVYAMIEMVGRAMYRATRANQFGSVEAYVLDALTDQFAKHLVDLKRNGLAEYKIEPDGVKIGVATHGTPSDKALESATGSGLIVQKGVGSPGDLGTMIEELEKAKREGEGGDDDGNPGAN